MCGHGRTFFKILSGEPFLFFSQKNEKIPRFSLRNVCDLMIKKRNGFCLSGKKKTDTLLVTWRKKLQSFSDSDSESHSDPDFVQVEGWCVYVRETRQGPRNKTSQEHDLEVYLTQQVRPQWVSRSPPPVITEVHSQCYWYVWHITRHWYRQMQKCDISSSKQKIKWCTQEFVPLYGSTWADYATNRETVHLWLDRCTPCVVWPFLSLHDSTQTLSQHSSTSQRRIVSSFL